MSAIEALGFKVKKRDAKHGRLISIRSSFASVRFMVNHHNPGSKQVKTYSVKEFVDAMIELGLI